VVVVEEHSQHGGPSAQVQGIAWNVQTTWKLHTFGIKDDIIYAYGTRNNLWQAYGISLESIWNSILDNRHKVHQE